MDLGNDLWPNDLVGEVMVTRDGYVWVILPRGGGLLVFDSNGTPSITTDDDWRFLNTDADNGKLPSNYVYALEEDLDGEIWVGTGSGPAIFYRSESIFNTEMSSASQILIQQDGNYQYLLETETVNSIIIDGGNRKWLGTAGSGVYVLSDDGLTIEHHFSSENSPLPSNNITDIAINQANGEVFVATSRGTISYLGEATNWDSSMENMFVFPNPVGPNYDGNITIDGLDYESTVHITDAAGRLIATVPSMGGRAVWDGKLSDGNLAPYGVYLIFATDHEGKTSATTKLAITR
jgi:ligand-binding sensor domain-containing protein